MICSGDDAQGQLVPRTRGQLFKASLVVNLLTALAKKISKILLFLLKKCEQLLHLFSKNIKSFYIFRDQSFNNSLTNGIVSFVKQIIFETLIILYCVYSNNFAEKMSA